MIGFPVPCPDHIVFCFCPVSHADQKRLVGFKFSLALTWNGFTGDLYGTSLDAQCKLRRQQGCEATNVFNRHGEADGYGCRSTLSNAHGLAQDQMITIAFDESGNTGQNLTDPNSPLFALASCSFNNAQVAELTPIFSKVKASELKFKNLAYRSAGQKMILEFLRSDQVSAQTVKIDLVHKRLMVIAKLVDLCIEPWATRNGQDIYKGALNIAMCNLLYTFGPVLLPSGVWEELIQSFTELVWKKEIRAWLRFMSAASTIYHHTRYTKGKFADLFATVLRWKGNYKEFIELIGQDELDPIPSSYTLLANAWGKQLGTTFTVLADEAKILSKHKPILMKLSDPGLRPAKAGYNSRTMEYPLKVANIIAVESHLYKEVQFADLFSGAACIVSRKEVGQTGTFEYQVAQELSKKKLICNTLLPSNAVTPKELGAETDESNSVNLNDYAARILNDDPTVRH